MEENELPDFRLGTAGTELTLDHMLAFRDRVEAEADRPPEPYFRPCLLCNRFIGGYMEMMDHWREVHGIDPVRALYGGEQ